jgi:hypothetical protein
MFLRSDVSTVSLAHRDGSGDDCQRSDYDESQQCLQFVKHIREINSWSTLLRPQHIAICTKKQSRELSKLPNSG